MNRAEWNNAYAARIVERTDVDLEVALEIAEEADEEFLDGKDPVEAADEELSYWENDE